MKTDERDEAALFSSPLFLHGSFFCSLFRVKCALSIFVRVWNIFGEIRASAQAPRAVKNSEKHKTLKNTSVFSRKSHVTLQKKTLASYFTFYFRARERRQRERERDAHTHALMSSGVITRAQKRRMGLRDLWDVIVNNDDICFEHILPWLEPTDIKLLHDVNSETRALIKRSPYVDELEEKFRIDEMSSISTLEFAWNTIQWGAKSRGSELMDQAWFCWQVAATNKLELLRWVREEKKCEWGTETIDTVAQNGNLEMLKYCLENQCPMDEGVCTGAAAGGSLECLKYLHEEVKAPWDRETAVQASKNGHLHVLEYLVEKKYDKYVERTCYVAAKFGQLDCLKYLHETAKAPWDSDAVRKAHENNHPECLQYLLDNDCPLPVRWRYEHGTLHSLP